MIQRQEIVPSEGRRSPYSYSPGILVEGMLFVSGQVPVDPVTGTMASGFANQMRLCLENVRRVAVAAGGRLEDAVRVGVYLADLANFEEMDTIYQTFFEQPFPARTTLQVGLNGVDVEIDAVIRVRAK